MKNDLAGLTAARDALYAHRNAAFKAMVSARTYADSRTRTLAYDAACKRCVIADDRLALAEEMAALEVETAVAEVSR